ncbi:MAG: hypothetical protein S0880_01105 [Actinomycetota bacterium]|nr:hypothetical protein [Actinomycetota bacterium]
MASTEDVGLAVIGVDDGPGERPPARPGRAPGPRGLGPLGVVLLLLAGMVAITLLDDPGGDAPTGPTTSTTSTATSADVAPNGSTDGTGITPTRRFPAIRLLDTAAISGRLAITTEWRTPGEVSIWIVDGHRVTARHDVVVHGGWRHQLLFADGSVVFPGLAPSAVDGAAQDEQVVAAMAPDGGLEVLRGTEPTDELIPGSRVGEVWTVRSQPSAPLVDVRRLDAAGAGVETLLDGARVVWAGVGDGILAYDGSGSADGFSLTHWSPALGRRPITAIADPGTSVLDAAGDLLAVYEPGWPGVVVVDVVEDARLAELAISFPLHACLSPDGTRLAIAGSRGPDHVDVLDVTDPGAVPFSVQTDRDIVDLTWAGPDQVIAVTNRQVLSIRPDGTDPDGAGPVVLAELTGAEEWRITSETAPC